MSGRKPALLAYTAQRMTYRLMKRDSTQLWKRTSESMTAANRAMISMPMKLPVTGSSPNIFEKVLKAQVDAVKPRLVVAEKTPITSG